MSLSLRTQSILTEALSDQFAASEINTAITSASSGSAGSFNTLVIATTSAFTGNATFGGTVAVTGASTLAAVACTTITASSTSTFTGIATFTAAPVFTGGIGIGSGQGVKVNGVQVVGAQVGAVTVPTLTTPSANETLLVTEIAAILAGLRAHGLFA